MVGTVAKGGNFTNRSTLSSSPRGAPPTPPGPRGRCAGDHGIGRQGTRALCTRALSTRALSTKGTQHRAGLQGAGR